MPRPTDAPKHPLLARVFLAAAAAAAAWAMLLAATGGFETTLFGLPIRSHDATRPLWASGLAFALFVWARGVGPLIRAVAVLVRDADRWLARRHLPYCGIALVLGAGVLIYGVGWGTGVAGGSDSYGYISQSDLWLKGLPIVRQPWTSQVPWPDAVWTFSPLGYRPALDGSDAIVAGYAVGLPLLMAAARFVGGHSAVFWLAPVAGAMLVLVTYAVGCWLDSPAAGAIAAWLAATSATLIGEVASPLSDVIAAGSLSASCWLLFRSPERIPVPAGLAAALAIAVRPNLAPTLAVMALWVTVRPPLPGMGRMRQLAHAILLLAAASPGLLLPAWANWRLFGSPFISGYGDFETIYDWSHVLPNLAQYPALLLRSRAVPALIGFAVLLIPARRLWPRLADRTVLWGIALFVFSLVAQYMAYEPATGEGYLRFLLPCWPFVMTGAARVLLLIARPGWPALLVAFLLLAQGVASIQGACHDGGCDNRGERKYPSAGAIVRSRTEPGSIIYSFQHSGSLRYYGGRMTLRYDILDRQWLDRSIEWFADRGVHPYAVLDDWEVAKFRERFAGQRRVNQIDRPLVTYRGTVVTHFYDLLAPPGEPRDTDVRVDRFDGPRYPRPAEPPAFTLSGRSAPGK
jgi:hypothetical protein